jgi:TolB-like protein/Flp pilus assembly protein TadD
MIGQTISHYRIIERIGLGGMGIVYRAYDQRLERDVALKVLPADSFADASARKRFRKEALALAALNDPNIATIFDFDSQGGIDFLVMEFVAGCTLADRTTRSASAESEALSIGEQIARALEHAHAAHIVHCDLKPSNIIVTPKGQLKLLDFGLAKLLGPVSEATTLSLSPNGNPAGTLPYMSPEQLRGETPDARSDIYAAGATLYEMVTGKRAFDESVSTALIDAILHKSPIPPSRFNLRLTPQLENIILKCLEKDKEQRYQSAKELAIDLHRLSSPSTVSASHATSPSRKRIWTVVAMVAALLIITFLWGFRALWQRPAETVPLRIRSLAVLPLENLSRDPDQEYFAEGMTDELIARLSAIGALRVISRTSVMSYKTTTKPLPQVARELNVDAVIEGSVLRSGDRVRITAQLIEGIDDKHLWANSYERDLRDVLTLQDEVARTIANEVNIELTPGEASQLSRSTTINPEAQEAYLRGRYAIRKRTRDAADKGIEYFNRALELQPNYAAAYAGLADSYRALGTLYFRPTEVLPKAKAAALKAVELNPNLAEGHAALAQILAVYDWNWPGAEREFERALELAPGDAETHALFAQMLVTIGRVGEGKSEFDTARHLDPLSIRIAVNSAWPYLATRQWEAAIAQYREALELDPNNYLPHLWLGYVYEQNRKLAEAIREYETAKQLDDTPVILAWEAHSYALSGQRKYAITALKALAAASPQRYVCPTNAAIIYAGLGDKEHALEQLEKAYSDHSECLLPILRFDERMNVIRSHRRFMSLLQRVGLPQ